MKWRSVTQNVLEQDLFILFNQFPIIHVSVGSLEMEPMGALLESHASCFYNTVCTALHCEKGCHSCVSTALQEHSNQEATTKALH